MRRAFRAACYVVLAIVSAFYSTLVVAQNDAKDPFLGLPNEGTNSAQLAPAGPLPEAALPGDPLSGVKIALPPARAAAPATASDDLCRCVGEDKSTESAAHASRIRAALSSQLKEDGLEFTDQPLEEAIGLLQQVYDIPIKLDGAALKEAGIQPDKPINANLHGISLSAAIRLMLEEIDLTYIVRDEVLMVTTPDAANQLLQTCVYDVRDLMRATKKGNDFDSLIDSIVSCVATESWAENGGGESEIRPLQPGFLIVSQTHAVHDEIRGLLSTIRQMNNRPVVAVGAEGKAASGEEVVTQSYRLHFDNATVNDELRKQIHDLIVKSLPDERWDGRLANGEAVLLAVLNDRVVLRHKPEVQDTVEDLLTDSGVLVANDFCGGRTRPAAESGKTDEKGN
jgi:hypothetical protein